MSNWISEASEASFDEQVIARSRSTLVLVDFWAPWCGPCRTLGPILEAAVAARSGDVWLVKINSDENPGLAAQYGVRGIPAVKAFAAGQLVGEFIGLRDRTAVDAFIDSVRPSEEQRALTRAGELLASGNHGELAAVLQPLLQHPQYADEARLLIAQSHATRQEWPQSLAALDQIPAASPEAEGAAALRVRIELLLHGSTADEASWRQRIDAHPDDADARWGLAGRLLASNDVAGALEALLELVQRDRAYRDDGGRRAMLALFEQLGTNHDLSHEYRRRLQIYL